MMLRLDQIAAGIAHFCAGQAEQRLILQVISMGQDFLPQPLHRRFRISLRGQIGHGKAQGPVNDGLPGNADIFIHDGCAQHFVLRSHPVQHMAKLRLRGHPIHFKDIHQPVCPGLRLLQVPEQHAFLHRQQRINPFHPFAAAFKVRRHGFKFFLTPFRFAQVGGCRHGCVCFRQERNDPPHFFKNTPGDFSGLPGIKFSRIVIDCQGKDAASRQAVDAEAGPLCIPGTDSLSRVDMGRPELRLFLRRPFVHFAQVIKAQRRDPVRMEIRRVFSARIPEHVVTHAFMGNPVERLFYRHQIPAHVAGQALKHHRIDGGKPPDRAIGVQRFIQFFASVPFQLHRYRPVAPEPAPASAHGSQQGVVERKPEGVIVCAQEPFSIFSAHSHGQPGEFAAVILPV